MDTKRVLMSYRSHILVTGSSRGLGLGIVRELLQRDAHNYIIATCRKPTTSIDLQNLLIEFPERLLILPLDISSAESHVSAVEELKLRNINSLDAIIANAGVSNPNHPDDPFFNCSTVDMLEVYKTNVVGTMLTLQFFSPFLWTGQSKIAVLLSSRLGSLESSLKIPGYTSYRTSKAALNMLSVTYSQDFEVRRNGGKVLLLHPGWVQTDLGGSGNRKAQVTIEESSKGICQIISIACGLQSSKTELFEISSKKFSEFIYRFKTNNVTYVGYDGEIFPW